MLISLYIDMLNRIFLSMMHLIPLNNQSLDYIKSHFCLDLYLDRHNKAECDRVQQVSNKNFKLQNLIVR